MILLTLAISCAALDVENLPDEHYVREEKLPDESIWEEMVHEAAPEMKHEAEALLMSNHKAIQEHLFASQANNIEALIEEAFAKTPAINALDTETKLYLKDKLTDDADTWKQFLLKNVENFIVEQAQTFVMGMVTEFATDTLKSVSVWSPVGDISLYEALVMMAAAVKMNVDPKGTTQEIKAFALQQMKEAAEAIHNAFCRLAYHFMKFLFPMIAATGPAGALMVAAAKTATGEWAVLQAFCPVLKMGSCAVLPYLVKAAGMVSQHLSKDKTNPHAADRAVQAVELFKTHLCSSDEERRKFETDFGSAFPKALCGNKPCKLSGLRDGVKTTGKLTSLAANKATACVMEWTRCEGHNPYRSKPCIEHDQCCAEKFKDPSYKIAPPCLAKNKKNDDILGSMIDKLGKWMLKE